MFVIGICEERNLKLDFFGNLKLVFYLDVMVESFDERSPHDYLRGQYIFGMRGFLTTTVTRRGEL
jgi:hypothetical protein